MNECVVAPKCFSFFANIIGLLGPDSQVAFKRGHAKLPTYTKFDHTCTCTCTFMAIFITQMTKMMTATCDKK